MNKKKKKRIIFIRLSKRRFEKELKRRELKRLVRENPTLSRHKRIAKLHRKASRNHNVQVTPPNNFSIINNPEETLNYFKIIKQNMLKYEPVYVEMAEISKMTCDALIYHIALLQKIKLNLFNYSLKGSFPKEQKVLSLMKRSGFLHYFNTSKNNLQTDSNIIEIKYGHNVNNQIVKKICMFVNTKLKSSRVSTRPLYDIISEMMLNTKQHAYSKSKNDYSNWMLFLRFYPQKDCIDFIFMDTGHGIPKTVRKTKIEKANKWFSELGIKDFSQSDLLKSALDGAYRTRTGKGYRGKGLPRIYNYYKKGYISDLSFFSNKASLTFNGEEISNDLKTEMSGTLIYWKLTKESLNGHYQNM